MKGTTIEPQELWQLRILFAWECAEITEGRAATLLGLDRVQARRLKEEKAGECRRIIDEAAPFTPGALKVAR